MSDTTLSVSVNPSTATEQASTKVVAAVADVKNVDPTDLPPLYYAIDPDALDQLFQPQFQSVVSDTGQIQFTFAGCNVVVGSDNEVTVTPTDSDTESDLEV